MEGGNNLSLLRQRANRRYQKRPQQTKDSRRNLITFTDTETGGLDPRKDATVQIGAIKCLMDEHLTIVDVFNEFIYPPRNLLIRLQALAANRVDMVRVMSADPEIVVAKRFAKFVSDGPLFCAYNAPFDLAMLWEMQLRTGITFEYVVDKQNGWLDVLPMARRALKGVTANHKLKTVANYFGLAHEDAHDALADVQALREVYRNLRRLVDGKYCCQGCTDEAHHGYRAGK